MNLNVRRKKYEKKIIAIILLLFCFIGCATPKYNYTPLITKISKPTLKSTVKTYIGKSMLQQVKCSLSDAIFLSEDMQMGVPKTYILKKGYYLKKGEDELSEYYLPSPDADGGKIIESRFAYSPEAIQVIKENNKLCVITVFHGRVCVNNSNFEKKKKSIIDGDSFQQTLIYNGKVGNKINIGYREYFEDFAQPAFSNNVEYDLSESNIIGYKEAKIEIIKATNEYIEYKVLKNFNDTNFNTF